MEEEMVAAQAAQARLENQSLMSPMSPMSPVSKSSSRSAKRSPTQTAAAPDQFTGISCLLITWKSNPEVENLKVGHIS